MKKEEEEQKKMAAERWKKIKKIFSLSLLSGIIILAIASFLNYLFFGLLKSQGKPRVEILEKEYDLGVISMAAGKVSHTYEIKNIGDGDLKISGIRTSCHCTTAVLKVKDRVSPSFGMEGSYLPFWSETIKPGFLQVTFDPAFHGPQGVGMVARMVFFSTNDPQNKKVQLILIANVIP